MGRLVCSVGDCGQVCDQPFDAVEVRTVVADRRWWCLYSIPYDMQPMGLGRCHRTNIGWLERGEIWADVPIAETYSPADIQAMESATTHPGWWLAADGNWYPPAPPAPTPPKRRHRLRTTLIAAGVVIVAIVALGSPAKAKKADAAASTTPTTVAVVLPPTTAPPAAPATTPPPTDPTSPFAITYEAMVVVWDEEDKDTQRSLCLGWDDGSQDYVMSQFEAGMGAPTQYYDRSAVVEFLNDHC